MCPDRHCILATALEYADDAVPDPNANTSALKKLADDLFSTMGYNKHCGICGSKVLHWEQGRTKFKTREEALASMKVEEQDQILSRAVLEAMGVTFDAKQKLKNN